MAWSSSLSQAPPKSRPLSAAGGRGSNGSGQPAVSPVFSLGSGGGGSAGSNTAAEHLGPTDAGSAAGPPAPPRRGERRGAAGVPSQADGHRRRRRGQPRPDQAPG